MMPYYSIIKTFFHSSTPLKYLLLSIVLIFSSCIEFHNNFNVSKLSNTSTLDPISLPIILTPSPSNRYRHPFDQETAESIYKQQQYEGYNFKRYQLTDTHYNPQQHMLNDIQQTILFSMEPPTGIFDVGRAITIQDYQLLQVRDIRIMFINPTDRFKFCINEIYADSDAIRRVQQRNLPFCLNPSNKYPFYFYLYITQHKPMIFRTSLYFIISIYDGEQLVDEKIWPREIIAKVNINHLRISPLEAKNCGTKSYTNLILTNPHSHHIKISFENQVQTQQKVSTKNIMIPSQKNYKISLLSKQTTLGIITKSYESSLADAKYPKLYLPIKCVHPLEIDHFNIGILNSDRSMMEVIVPVTSYAREVIQIKSIEVISSNGNIQVRKIHEGEDKILPGNQHIGVCKLILHVPNEPSEKTTIEIKIAYFLISNNKQILQAKNTYKFYQLHNPLSLGVRRFIDITKSEYQLADPIMENIFPIRNNLNLPLILVRVIFDQKVFKLTWVKDRRQYIFPNQQRSQFSLQYIGPKQLKLSPTKYLIILQFNGNLLIPVQIIIYDHTLQCVYNQQQQKCNNMGIIDYGYFRNNATKFKQIIIRNWNPIPKEIKLKFLQNMVQNYGINCTMNIFGPFPSYQIVSRHNNGTLYFYLKGNHFIIINIAMTPLRNATSGEVNFQFSTQNQHIAKKIKFKVQNGTIALLPQILRISSAYEQALQYLNLVSTFSQPYKIKSTFVNSSNINIFFNNHSEIYENQWIGLAVVYEPFQHISSINPTSSLSTSTPILTSSSPLINITQHCCGNEFMINYFISPLYQNQFQRFTYISVRVVTTTELQANSTIIIDNNIPKMIKEDNFTISIINYNKNCPLPNKNAKQNNKECLKQNKQVKQNKDYVIKLKNIFKEYIKYKPIIIPRALYEDTKQYISTMKRARKIYEDTMLCVNNVIAVKHNFCPQMVKTILGLDAIPQQITIQPLENEEYYIGSQKKNAFDPNSTPQLSKYVRKAVAGGARVCYKMNTTKYIKQLIQSYILNDIAQHFSNQIFHLFVEKQMEFYNAPLHNLSYDQFYDSLEYNFEHYCKKSVYPFFRFCKQIGVAITPNTQAVLQPGAEGEITIKAISKFKESSQSFYVVLLNNITKYEVHYVEINITEPKLKIAKVYLPSPINNKERSKENLKNQNSEKTTEVLRLQTFIKSYMNKKDLSKLLKLKQNQIQQYDPYIKKYLKNILPIYLTDSDMKNSQYETIRNFTIKNTGTVDIHITHVGFQKQEKICELNGIYIPKNLCNGFAIQSGKEMNFSVGLSIPVSDTQNLKSTNLYLYNDDAFYFRLNVILKGSNNNGESSWQKSVYSLLMSLLSFFFLVLVIIAFKKEIDEKQNVKKMCMKTKIMNPSNYGMLGSRIQKKVRKLQPIPEQQIIAVKDIQQSKLKQFFNSSGESQISKRQHTEQEQPSKMEILNALKNDRVNMSASEEESIDFIDLNALNKSTQNMEEEQASKQDQQEQKGASEEQGSSGSNKDGSEADSNFNDGDEIDYSSVNQDYGWGDQSQERKKEEQKSNSYYNIFFSQNPLKKNEISDPFHWMKDQRYR